jgi:hypothetical protein
MRRLIEEWHSESYLAGRNQVFVWIEDMKKRRGIEGRREEEEEGGMGRDR